MSSPRNYQRPSQLTFGRKVGSHTFRTPPLSASLFAQARRGPNFLRGCHAPLHANDREDVQVKNPVKLLSISLALAAAAAGSALANQDLATLSANPSNWAMQAGDFANHRYSPLDRK